MNTALEIIREYWWVLPLGLCLFLCIVRPLVRGAKVCPCRRSHDGARS